MGIRYYPDFFNDVFGPVMQPGSSSHTAGPCRIGYIANGLLPDDENIFRIRKILEREGIAYSFCKKPITASSHPNAVTFHLKEIQ